jgi:endoglucanase
MPICEDITWPNRRVQTSDYINPIYNPDLYSSLSVVPTDTPHPDNYLPVIQIWDKILDYCNKVGMRVVLDMHCLAPNADNVLGGGGRWYTTTNPGDAGATAGVTGEPRSEQQWIDAWKFLANRYKNNSAVIGFDMMNEPHASTWDNDPNTGWPAAVERCANQVHQINPNLLIFVEGVAGNVDYTGVTGGQVWGSLWAGNLTGVATRPVTLNVPNKVVYSPHEYSTAGAGSPPWLTDSHFPGFMPGIWRTAWGYIAEQGLAPLWIGEFGANFAGGGNTIDNAWISGLCNYIIANKVNYAYWALNPGGTPNGILSGNDWVNVIQEDLDRIAPILSPSYTSN